MSVFDPFFKRKEPISSPNVEHPDSSHEAAQAEVPARPCEIDPELMRMATPVITERANAMFEAGTRPKSFYLVIDAVQSGPVAFALGNRELRAAVLVFTSEFQAKDYLRASEMTGEVHEIPANSLQSHMETWKKDGAGAFALDRCPRCLVCLAIPIKGRLTDEQVSRVWAIHRSARMFLAQRALRIWATPADQSSDHVATRREKRKLLESIRDHLDCSVPYLHWMIALEAGMSKDEDVRVDAIARMQEFGPMFSDKATLSSDGDEWITALAECHTGLLVSFEMLKSVP